MVSLILPIVMGVLVYLVLQVQQDYRVLMELRDPLDQMGLPEPRELALLVQQALQE